MTEAQGRSEAGQRGPPTGGHCLQLTPPAEPPNTHVSASHCSSSVLRGSSRAKGLVESLSAWAMKPSLRCNTSGGGSSCHCWLALLSIISLVCLQSQRAAATKRSARHGVLRRRPLFCGSRLLPSSCIGNCIDEDVVSGANRSAVACPGGTGHLTLACGPSPGSMMRDEEHSRDRTRLRNGGRAVGTSGAAVGALGVTAYLSSLLSTAIQGCRPACPSSKMPSCMALAGQLQLA